MPTISAEELMTQAAMTAADYMNAAVRYIDERFGDGYAQEHPELIAAFMQTCAQDFHTAMLHTHIAPGVKDAMDLLSRR